MILIPDGVEFIWVQVSIRLPVSGVMSGHIQVCVYSGSGQVYFGSSLFWFVLFQFILSIVRHSNDFNVELGKVYLDSVTIGSFVLGVNSGLFEFESK